MGRQKLKYRPVSTPLFQTLPFLAVISFWNTKSTLTCGSGGKINRDIFQGLER
jgi:hypothetical protein